MKNAIIWADIPVIDMTRARAFYAAILQQDVPEMEGSNGSVALLPSDQGGVGVDLAKGEDFTPCATGTTVYLDTGNDEAELDAMLSRVEPAGGKILQPKTLMGDVVGSIAFFLDSEGNRIGLHHGTMAS